MACRDIEPLEGRGAEALVAAWQRAFRRVFGELTIDLQDLGNAQRGLPRGREFAFGSLHRVALRLRPGTDGSPADSSSPLHIPRVDRRPHPRPASSAPCDAFFATCPAYHGWSVAAFGSFEEALRWISFSDHIIDRRTGRQDPDTNVS